MVVKDAAQCSRHAENPSDPIDLGEFYETLVRSQGGSLLKLLSSYASQDAAAAFRLAEVSELDLPSQLPSIVVSSADQPPFLSLAVEKLLAESEGESWARALAEAGLNSRLVAHILNERPAEMTSLPERLKKVPKKERWDVKGITGQSLYTQILTLASHSKPSEALRDFPRLMMLGFVQAPGGLRPWYHHRFITTALSMIFFDVIYINMVTTFGPNHGRHRTSFLYGFLLPLAPVAAGYLIMFRTLAVRMFYRTLTNQSQLVSPGTPPLASEPKVAPAFLTQLIWQFLTKSERRLVSTFTQPGQALRAPA